MRAAALTPIFLTISEAAAVAKVHRRTVELWIKQGKVPVYGHYRCYRVRLDELLPPRQHAAPYKHPGGNPPRRPRKPKPAVLAEQILSQ